LPHIPGGADALAAARESGALIATISGSGSALFALAAHNDIARVAEAMRLELDRRGGPASARTPAVAAGARIEIA
jgi:homoserine kinase